MDAIIRLNVTEIEVIDMSEKGTDFQEKDAAVLADIGYKPELRRNFSTIQTFGIAFSIMGIMPSIASTLTFNLTAGPVGMVWGWIMASICILSVGLSMAELGSSIPTSGGLYWWTHYYAPEKVKNPLCFLAGYSNTLGLIGGIVSIDYGFALMVMSCVVINSDGVFTYTSYEVYAIFVACILSHAVVGSISSKQMAKIQTCCIYANIMIVLVTIIALPIGAHNRRNNGAYIFAHFENATTWPDGWAFFLAWLAPIWTIGSFDSCVHMAEEAANATVAVPLGIISSIVMCGILGFIIQIVICASMTTDIASILESPFGQPMAQIYYDALGKKWTLALMILLAMIQWFMGLSIVVAASRQSWAFSRDGALPFSKFLRVINTKFSAPVRTTWGCCIVGAVIGALCMIDATAASALFSLAATSNCLAWLLPIVLKLTSGKNKFKPGPFYMGPLLSQMVGWFASIYLMFVIILLMFPESGPEVNAQTMNYTVVINVAVWSGALIYYYVDAYKWFMGPKSTLDFVIDGVDVEKFEYDEKIENIIS